MNVVTASTAPPASSRKVVTGNFRLADFGLPAWAGLLAVGLLGAGDWPGLADLPGIADLPGTAGLPG
jgi:hypothetical protein